MTASFLRSSLVMVCTAGLLYGCGGGGKTTDDSAPTINQQPLPASGTTGQTITFAVGADGGRLHYVWARNNEPIPNTDHPSYSFIADYTDNNAKFSVVVTNSAGQVTSSSALMTLLLTPDQATYEQTQLHGGTFRIVESLVAGNLQPATSYIEGVSTQLASTPLVIGPEFTTETEASLAASLDNVTPRPTFVLAPVSASTTSGTPTNTTPTNTTSSSSAATFDPIPAGARTQVVNYVAGGVQVETMPTSGTQVGTQPTGSVPLLLTTRSNFTLVPLSGLIGNSPAELKNYYQSLFSNSSAINLTASYTGTAPAYLKYTETLNGDTVFGVDCNGQPAPTSPNTSITPCPANGATLQQIMINGVYDPVNGVTHVLADGTLIMLNNQQIWVAATATVSSIPGGPTTYLTYAFADTNLVYQGELHKDGTILPGPQYSTGATTTAFTAYHLNLNADAFNSISSNILF